MNLCNQKIIFKINVIVVALSLPLFIGYSTSRVSADDGNRFAAGQTYGQIMFANLFGGRSQSSEIPGVSELKYGKNALQKIDYWRPTTNGSPLIVFVHGGAWMYGDKRNATGENKIRHYLQQGYAFASINYRLLPDCTVEQQAQDVASTLAYLISHAETLGFDPKRVVMMGHSAGAHLSALVGTDMRYLKDVGLIPESLCGIILIDGAAYDVPRQITDGGWLMRRTYKYVFGEDQERQLALSPMHHTALPNTPVFLVLHVQRPDGIAQSQAFAKALKDAGTSVEVHSFEGRGLTGHVEINNRLGDPSYPATPVVDEWLRRIFTAKK